MLDAAGEPRPEYQPWYRLHMKAEGYALWASIVRPILEADLRPQAGSQAFPAERGVAADRPGE
jgi:hypothetical protein